MRPLLRLAGGTALVQSVNRRHTTSASAGRLPLQAWVFWGLVVGVATVLCGALAWRQPPTRYQWSQILLWLLIGLLAHAGEFEINRPDRAKIYLSAGFAISSIAMAELPTVGAMIAVAFGSVTINQITKNRHPLATVLFNRGALALCAAAGSIVYGLVAPILPHWGLLSLVG
ncbi:MAG TPA: hypothetical protein VIU62_12195, partial [Chloroflexota bacterium]